MGFFSKSQPFKQVNRALVSGIDGSNNPAFSQFGKKIVYHGLQRFGGITLSLVLFAEGTSNLYLIASESKK